MLVLTRIRDEFIKVGSNIVIRVIRTSKGSVRIGIDAPDSVRILRGEIATVESSDEFSVDSELSSPCFEDSADECLFEAMLVQS